MKILSVSDIQIGFLYSPQITQRYHDVDVIISCGDLPYYYLEYMLTMLDVPLYYVRGNHASPSEIGIDGERTYPWGGIDIHRRVKRDTTGLLMAGIEGSLQYNYGPHQYSQFDMWMYIFGLVPGLLINKLRFGRYLDVFVTHASPWKIHDMDDLPHRGIKAFRWFDQVFQPKVHLHGHIHVYRQDAVTETQYFNTRIINTYGYKELKFEDSEFRRKKR